MHRVFRCAPASLVVVLLVATATLHAAEPRPVPNDDRSALHDAVNAALGLHRSTVVEIDVVAVPRAGERDALVVAVPFDGAPLILDLEPHSVRADGYRVVQVDGAGRRTEVPAGPENTYRGTVRGVPGAIVAASFLEGGLEASIDLAPGAGTGRWRLEALDRRGPEYAGLSVLYNADDALPSGGVCGVGDILPEGDGAGGEDAAALGGPACEVIYVAQLACDADFPYFQDWGGGTEDRINSVVNAVNVQYESQVGIRHEITAIIIRTSSTYTTNNPGDLLSEFRSRWLSQHSDVIRDVAHLFTGRNLSGSTIGIAWTIGGICTTGAYCLSESDCCGSFGCARPDLTAHELGHLWGAFHCDPCSNTMRSFIGCFNNFSGGSITSIVNHRNSRDCLDGPEPYCNAVSSSANDEFIANVTLGSLDNDSGAAGYSYFGCLATELERGPLHTLTVTIGDASSADIGAAWIDWNQDLDFNDEDETLATDWSGSGPYVLTFGVPTSALLGGQTRLRIRIQDGDAQPFIGACGPSTVGEVEDYSLRILDDEPGPANDACADALTIAEGSTPFTNLAATTDGPAETLGCDFSGDPQISSDVWFAFDAPCTALVTVDVCTSDYDTELAVYESCPVPVQVPVVACNDDACGAGGTRSLLFFGAIEGVSYRIRVGGFQGAQGSGTINVSSDCVAASGACCFADGTCTVETAAGCGGLGGTYEGDATTCAPNPCPQPDPCPADIDGSGAVDFPDILAILAAWGPCPACPEDIDDTGVVDFQDLLAVLATWGPCD